jgi:hypothetical protein
MFRDNGSSNLGPVMRTLWLCGLFLVLAALPASGRRLVPDRQFSHKHHTSPNCDYRLALCKAKVPDKIAGCETLYQEAMASGGYWGEPEARAKAHFRPGRIKLCVP